MIITQPKEVIAEFVASRIGISPEFGNFTAIGLVRRDYLIAGVVYNQFGGANVCAHIGAIEGGHWLTPAFLYAMFDYPFNQIGKRRITALIPRKNKRSRKFVEHLGFKIEGVMQHYFERDDMCCYGLIREKCRFIEQERKAA